MDGTQTSTAQDLARAVEKSARVAAVAVGPGRMAEAGGLYRQHFDAAPALIIADENTWGVGGAALARALSSAGISVREHVMPAVPRVKPSRDLGDSLAELIRPGERFIALGSGVVNDLTKYAAFTCDVPYMCVATAASMDGYTSAGAPLTDKGFKKTIDCRPPKVVLADTDIVANAPAAMAGWGFGDLAGKMPAGGDWLISDALGIEAIDDVAWPMVQGPLHDWLDQAAAVGAAEGAAIDELFVGLALIGFAMEFHGTSRPASGADHQVAHIWEMDAHHHNGERVSHGACVAVGCMVSLKLYDWLLAQDLTSLDIDACVAAAPSPAAIEAEIRENFSDTIAARALSEMAAKQLDAAQLRARLDDVVRIWPALSTRLRAHLWRAPQMEARLRAAGAPIFGDDIGIDGARLRATVAKARYIRSRYTVLDLLAETGLLDRALDATIAPAA